MSDILIILESVPKKLRASVLQSYIAEHGPIPDEYGDKVKQLLIGSEEEKYCKTY